MELLAHHCCGLARHRSTSEVKRHRDAPARPRHPAHGATVLCSGNQLPEGVGANAAGSPCSLAGHWNALLNAVQRNYSLQAWSCTRRGLQSFTMIRNTLERTNSSSRDGMWKRNAMRLIQIVASPHADFSQGGVRKCRVALVSPLRDGANAIEVLGEEARAFIDDWDRRHLTGYRKI